MQRLVSAISAATSELLGSGSPEPPLLITEIRTALSIKEQNDCLNVRFFVHIAEDTQFSQHPENKQPNRCQNIGTGTEMGMLKTQFIKMTRDTKIAFITGGNRGLGLQTARELGHLGILVVIGSRDGERGKAAAATLRSEGVAAESLLCDVTKPKDHRAVRDYFEQRYGRLDILINNAGVSIESEEPSSTPPVNRTSAISPTILRETFETNFFGPVALTQTLLPLVRKAPAGRIVNLSSILGSLTLHSDPRSHIYLYKVFAYDASKTALNAFTVHLAHELRETPIKVNSAHPGWVKTDMGGPDAELEVAEGAKTSAQLATLPANGPTGGYFYLREPLPW